MRRILFLLLAAAVAFVALVTTANYGVGPLLITREGEQKIVLLFGEVRTVTGPGWDWKIPWLEDVQTYDARWLYLSTEPLPIQTRDGEQLSVDNYVLWRVSDPVEFRRAFRGDMALARDRIDRTVRDEVREVIGRNTLAEVLEVRRSAIMQEITENSRREFEPDGLEVADVRINRTELPQGTEDSVYARMNAERERLARKNRAEGEERARRIRAETDREATVIVANAQRDAEIIRGEGDALASGIYAEAHGRDPEFYAFVRSLEAYRKVVGDQTTVVLSPDSEFFQYLQGGGPGLGARPAGP